MKQTKKRTRTVADPVTEPQPPPIVRHGDALAVIHAEISNVFDELNKWRKFSSSISAYATAHPAEYKHLVDFIAAQG